MWWPLILTTQGPLASGNEQRVEHSQLAKGSGINTTPCFYSGFRFKDFIAKMSIARKEARETLYWLRLANALEVSKGHELNWEINEAGELRAMIVAAIKTAQANLARRSSPKPFPNPSALSSKPSHWPTLNVTDATFLSHMIVILPPASVMSVNAQVSCSTENGSAARVIGARTTSLSGV